MESETVLFLDLGGCSEREVVVWLGGDVRYRVVNTRVLETTGEAREALAV